MSSYQNVEKILAPLLLFFAPSFHLVNQLVIWLVTNLLCQSISYYWMCKYRRDILKRWPYHSALPLTKSKTQWARSLSLVRGGFHSSAFCDYPPTRNHATHRGSLILQTCRGGRGLQILTVITLNIIHTVQTVIKAWKWHGRAVIAEGRRNEEEWKRE